MNKFKSLEHLKENELESKLSKKWDDMDLLNKSIDLRKNNGTYVFYDGPATANGMPGVHHMLAKILKDTFCKYETMNGKKVLRKVGWDTHGLPVEVQVEKELGFSGKSDIEAYGIKQFNEKCRESVWKNEDAFNQFTKEMGQLIDLKHPYITYDNNYIETEWWILKKLFDEGYIYEGLKVTPYCPRCGTSLASHEVAQGYKTIDELGQERIRRAAKKIKEETHANIDYGFKHYIIKDVDANTLDKLEKFEPNYMLSDETILDKFGIPSILTTWMINDGYGLTDKYEKLQLEDYEAYKCNNTVYLINPNLSSKAIKCLIEKYENKQDFDCNRIVLFGYSFNLTEIQTLKDNLKQIKNIKDLTVDVITRY